MIRTPKPIKAMGEEERTGRCDVQEEENEEMSDDDDDEALSLSDLPVLTDSNKPERPSMTATNPPKSSSESPEFFEFFSNLTCQMSSAEDIIFSGKLVPFAEQSPSIMQTLPRPDNSKDDGKLISPHRRSESFSGFQSYVNRSHSTKAGLMRNSRSLNYHRLERFSGSKNSWDSDMELNSSINGTGKGDSVAKKTARPGWFVLMFGMVKPPAEMELRDIKSRQVRRNIPSTMFPPPVDGRGKIQVNRNSGKGSCWLLKVLSCRDHASVAVMTTA